MTIPPNLLTLDAGAVRRIREKHLDGRELKNIAREHGISRATLKQLVSDLPPRVRLKRGVRTQIRIPRDLL